MNTSVAASASNTNSVSPSNFKVAVLGLGIIGEIWARNLQSDGVSIKTWNRTPKSFPGFTSDIKEAAQGADFIFIVVADPAAVQSVLTAITPVLQPGQMVIQSSTISAKWSKEFAQQVTARGARFLEAPFTGSKPAAEQRKTVFYVGGSPEDLNLAKPILQKLSTHILHIGSLGQASSLKLAMNINIAMVMEALNESLTFARAAGISDDIYFDALRINGSKSGISDLKEAKLKAADYAPQFSLKHMDKDLRLALEEGSEVRLPQLVALKTIYDEGMKAGKGDLDFSVLMQQLIK